MSFQSKQFGPPLRLRSLLPDWNWGTSPDKNLLLVAWQPYDDSPPLLEVSSLKVVPVSPDVELTVTLHCSIGPVWHLASTRTVPFGPRKFVYLSRCDTVDFEDPPEGPCETPIGKTSVVSDLDGYRRSTPSSRPVRVSTCAYFSFLYEILLQRKTLSPSSFPSSPVTLKRSTVQTLIYSSYLTLTTLTGTVRKYSLMDGLSWTWGDNPQSMKQE